ncbi:MAG: UvrD-helicase domain-containing protein [Sarcina sp.]
MGTRWTEEQKQAIYTRDSNLLVAAAAGSGKTAVLVERIIKMLTEGENLVDIDRLLVVTFTNAAAAEMRERIGDAISDALEKDPSSSVLQRQLSLLNRSNIMTMHSFCLNVIRSNYHLIDLDPGVRIADEAEAAIIKDDIIAELLEDRYEERNQDFLNLIDAFASGNNDEKIKDEILSLYRFVMSGPWPEKWLREKAEKYNIKNKEELSENIWARAIMETLEIDFESYKGILLGLLERCNECDWLEPYGLTIADDLAQIVNATEAIKTNDIEKAYAAIKRVKFSRIKTLKKGTVADETLKEDIKNSRDTVKKAVGKISDDIPSEDINDVIEGLLYMYPIVKCLGELVIEFKEKFSHKKREKNIIDFNDIEHLCLKILIQKDGEEIKASTIANEFKEKFVEVLVDEYQDSSNIQETIINMVSRREEENPNAFMVGDVKQSIYKFRQAKPELFLDKYETYSTEDGAKNKKIMLFKNFRSRKEILDAANYIFETLMTKRVGELDYTEIERLNLGFPYAQLVEENMIEGESVETSYNSLEAEVHILDKDGMTPLLENESGQEQKELVVFDGEEGSEGEEEEIEDAQYEARIIARRIQELMTAKDGKYYVVWDKGQGKYRRLRYKDIVILLRATKTWSAGIVEELGAVGIPVYADTGTGYFDATEIRTIMSLLNIIDNPMQDIYLIASLRSPIFSFTSEELGELRLVSRDKYFYENIQKVCNGETDISQEIKVKCEYFMSKLSTWRDKAEYTPIDELIWSLYTDTSYFGYVGAMPNGPQRQANLKILFQRARQYEETSFKGVFNFINFIKKMRKSASNDLGSAKILGENEDVVRIMSIHKSKGLEFPVVFLSGTGKQFNLMDLKKSIQHHDELGIGVDVVNVQTQNQYTGMAKTAIKKKAMLEALSEEMRILYVALTRPREKLIITGAVRDIDKKFDKWYEAGIVSKGEKVDPSKLIGERLSYLDWIGMALSKHPDGDVIRGLGKEIISTENESKWNIKKWIKSDLVNKVELELEEKEVLDLEKSKNDICKEILDRLDFKYKYEGVCNIPSNISVSDLKKKAIEGNEEIINLFKEEDIEEFNREEGDVHFDEISEKLPSFMKEKIGITPAQRGTITHFVMQHVDYDKVHVNDINKLLDKMVIKELLTDEEAKVVNPYKISGFFRTELGERLLRAYKNGYKVYRELPFFREFKVTDLYSDLDKDVYKNEMLRLQGIIDCFFEDEDGIVLIDYKTDYVERGNEEKILERYKIQIDLYSQTLEQILGKKVDEKYLYLFGIDKGIKY